MNGWMNECCVVLCVHRFFNISTIYIERKINTQETMHVVVVYLVYLEKKQEYSIHTRIFRIFFFILSHGIKFTRAMIIILDWKSCQIQAKIVWFNHWKKWLLDMAIFSETNNNFSHIYSISILFLVCKYKIFFF